MAGTLPDRRSPDKGKRGAASQCAWVDVSPVDAGELPAQRPGTRRQVLLSDVLEYRERRRQRQYDMLAATAVDIDDEDDPAEIAAQLREVRKAVAARRRG